jgi:hypothetical protein
MQQGGRGGSTRHRGGAGLRVPPPAFPPAPGARPAPAPTPAPDAPPNAQPDPPPLARAPRVPTGLAQQAAGQALSGRGGASSRGPPAHAKGSHSMAGLAGMAPDHRGAGGRPAGARGARSAPASAAAQGALSAGRGTPASNAASSMGREEGVGERGAARGGRTEGKKAWGREGEGEGDDGDYGTDDWSEESSSDGEGDGEVRLGGGAHVALRVWSRPAASTPLPFPRPSPPAVTCALPACPRAGAAAAPLSPRGPGQGRPGARPARDKAGPRARRAARGRLCAGGPGAAVGPHRLVGGVEQRRGGRRRGALGSLARCPCGPSCAAVVQHGALDQNLPPTALPPSTTAACNAHPPRLPTRRRCRRAARPVWTRARPASAPGRMARPQPAAPRAAGRRRRALGRRLGGSRWVGSSRRGCRPPGRRPPRVRVLGALRHLPLRACALMQGPRGAQRGLPRGAQRGRSPQVQPPTLSAPARRPLLRAALHALAPRPPPGEPQKPQGQRRPWPPLCSSSRRSL